jgi:hypothetical protein
LGVTLGLCRCAGFPAAHRILRVAALIVCLCIAVQASEVSAQSPAPRPVASGSAVQTVTLVDLTSPFNIEGPWKLNAGDEPSFANATFDDSGWPSIRTSQPFQAAGIRSLPTGYLWARIHLHVPTAAGPLALVINRLGYQYEVFANGSRIASTPGMAARTRRLGWGPPIALPPSGDIVLAIRFYCGEGPIQSLPFARVSMGSIPTVRADIEFQHLNWFNNETLASFVCICVSLLMAIPAIILYRLQRDHDEYLWFGILCLVAAVYACLDAAILSGWLPLTLPVILAINCTGILCMAAEIEFVMRLTRIRRRWPIRILQGVFLIAPVLNASPSTRHLYFPALVIAWAVIPSVETACFVSAYRRRTADSGVLLLFLLGFAAIDVLSLAYILAIAFPGAVPWGPSIHFGPVGIRGNYLANLVASLGLAAVVLYRFIRVARDEAHAAAELEAARTVQQILVPEEVPSIPGFSIQAVYHPAGQVGGDFYQVLPTPNGDLLAVIGDVSGKGMPAAMTVSLLVGTVRTLAHYTHDPTEILTAMNHRLIGRGSGFTTALVLRLDSDGTLTAANAGHIAPYANGKELTIDNGLPLGITAAAAYCNSTLHLEHGTTLTLLTDGVVEAQNAKGELFGFDRTAQISSKPAQTVAEAAQTFGQTDDITVLSLALVAGV